MVKEEIMIGPFKGIYLLTPVKFDSNCSEINDDFEILEETKTHITV